MASAYELMLVLRGRNYISNDLRRAGADVGRLSTMRNLQNSQALLQSRQKHLNTQKATAESELQSMTTGTKRLALNKQIAAQIAAQEAAVTRVRQAEEKIESVEAQRLRNAATVSAAQRKQLTSFERYGATSPQFREATLRLQAAQVDQERLRSSAATANKALEDNKAALAAAGAGAAAMADKEKLLNDSIATQKVALAESTAALEANEAQLARNAALIEKATNTTRVANFANTVEHLGRAMQTLGFVGTAAVGGAAYMAAKFQTQVTLAATQSTLPGQNTSAQVLRNSTFLQQQILRTMLRGGAAASSSDLTSGLYNIFSSISLKGNQKQQLQEGLNLLKEFQKVYVANYGQVQFNDVVRAGTALINNFGLSIKQLPGVLNTMQASVRFGQMTMGQFVSSLSMVVPAYKSAHYSFSQMAADIAVVSRLFPNLRMGTTGLARLTETFGKYHAQFSQFIGRNIAPGGNLLPVEQIIQMLIQKDPTLAKGGVALQDIMKTVTGSQSTYQARRVFVELATNMGLYHQVAGQVLHDNNELNKSFTDMSQTPQVRWAEFTHQLQGLILEVGTKALPDLTKMADAIKKLINWFDNLSPSTKNLIEKMALWGSVGTLAIGSIMAIGGALTKLGASIRLLLLGKAGMAGLEDGFITTSTVMRASFVGAIILAIPLIIKYHTQIMHLINELGGLKTVLKALGVIIAGGIFVSLATGFGKTATEASGAAKMAGLLNSRLRTMAAIAAAGIAIKIVYDIVKGKSTSTKSAIEQSLEFGALAGLATKNPIIGATAAMGAFAVIGGHSVVTDQAVNNSNLPYFLNGRWYSASGQLLTQAGQSYWNRLLQQGQVAQSQILSPFTRPGAPGSLGGLRMRQAALARARVRHDIQHNGAAVTLGTGTFSDAQVNAAVQNLLKLYEAEKMHPSLKNAKAYEDALTALKTKASKDQYAAAVKYLDALEQAENKANTKRVSEAKKTANTLKQQLQDLASNVTTMYDQLYQQNQSIFGTLFSGPYLNSPLMQTQMQYGYVPQGTDLLKDLKSQVSGFRSYMGAIGTLRKRGAPQELITELMGLGQSALPQIQSLANLGKAQWKEYLRVFKQGQALLHQQTMSQLASQLKDYRKYGNDIAIQIIEGMRDQRIGLQAELKKMIEDMFGISIPDVHKASHDSKLSGAAKVHASHTRSALGHHARIFKQRSHTTKPDYGTPERSVHPGGRSTGMIQFNFNMNTGADASIKTQVKHAIFASRAALLTHPTGGI